MIRETIQHEYRLIGRGLDFPYTSVAAAVGDLFRFVCFDKEPGAADDVIMSLKTTRRTPPDDLGDIPANATVTYWARYSGQKQFSAHDMRHTGDYDSGGVIPIGVALGPYDTAQEALTQAKRYNDRYVMSVRPHTPGGPLPGPVTAVAEIVTTGVAMWTEFQSFLGPGIDDAEQESLSYYRRAHADEVFACHTRGKAAAIAAARQLLTAGMSAEAVAISMAGMWTVGWQEAAQMRDRKIGQDEPVGGGLPPAEALDEEWRAFREAGERIFKCVGQRIRGS